MAGSGSTVSALHSLVPTAENDTALHGDSSAALCCSTAVVGVEWCECGSGGSPVVEAVVVSAAVQCSGQQCRSHTARTDPLLPTAPHDSDSDSDDCMERSAQPQSFEEQQRAYCRRQPQRRSHRIYVSTHRLTNTPHQPQLNRLITAADSHTPFAFTALPLLANQCILPRVAVLEPLSLLSHHAGQ